MKIDHREMFCKEKSRLSTLRCCRVSDSGAKGENGDAAFTAERCSEYEQVWVASRKTKGLIQAGVVASRKLKG